MVSPGPVTAGYGDLFFSAKDFVSGYATTSTDSTTPSNKYWTNPIDHALHGNVDFVPWYLQQFAAYEAARASAEAAYEAATAPALADYQAATAKSFAQAFLAQE